MQNNNKLKKFINKLTSTQRAQGAIEYLLIIGVVIIIVAIAIIALSGVLNSAKEETSQKEYYNSYADLKYQHIGFPISVKPGEHILFTLAVQPKNNSLLSIFSEAPTDTKVTINKTSTYQKTLTGWTNQGENAIINQGDYLEIVLPENATNPLNLVIKGDYTSPPPRKIYFDCDGTEEKCITYRNLPFEPKEKDAKLIFKDFFENLHNGSNLNIYGSNSYYYYYAFLPCEGNPCTNLNETQCNDNFLYCYWEPELDELEEGNCKTNYGVECKQFENPWNSSDCISVGCQIGTNPTLYIDDTSYPNPDDPLISLGDNITINCKLGQVIHAEIEENLNNSAQEIEQLTLNAHETKTFVLKNYSCYSFTKLFNKLKSELITGQQTEEYIYLICARGTDYAYSADFKSDNYDYNYFSDPSSMLMYPDTICSIYSYTPTINPIQITC
ncbi:MAG: hypothetical protein WCX66_00295 [archaeon]